MQKLCCVRTRQHLCQFGLFRHKFTTVSPPILNHFWWELYQNSIHSAGQMKYFKTRVDDKSIKVGGKQRLETLEGYSMPIIFKDGLAYIKTLGRLNDQELETYPHVFFTSPDTWEPSLLDHEFSPEDELAWSQLQDTRPFYDLLFDAQGDLNKRIIATLNTFLDLPDHNDTSTFNIN